MIIKQLSVFVENKPGRLLEITSVLGDNGIDIRAMSLADTTKFGILRLIVNEPGKAENILKEAGFTVSLTQVLALGLKDTPGGLAAVLKILKQAGIEVEYVYAFFVSCAVDYASVIIRVEDNDKAAEVLKENGVKLLDAEEVYNR